MEEIELAEMKLLGNGMRNKTTDQLTSFAIGLGETGRQNLRNAMDGVSQEPKNENEEENKDDNEDDKKVVKVDPPNFNHLGETESFSSGEKVYIIDPNGFDLWEGVIENIHAYVNSHAEIDIHYPDYPDDDEKNVKIERILKINEINKAIFDKQEQIREIKEKATEQEKAKKPTRKSRKKNNK